MLAEQDLRRMIAAGERFDVEFKGEERAALNDHDLDYSALVVPEARWADIDPLELERLRQTIRKFPGRADNTLLSLSDVEIVKALGLGEGGERIERVRVAGLLLVGREDALRRLVPTHEVAFQVLGGTRVSMNDFFRWPLIRLADEIVGRFLGRNEEEEFLHRGIRVGIPDYSPDAFREALHNALIHRDYSMLGAVHVQWRDAEIEMVSPGSFVEGVRLDNLLVTGPRPRNPILADAFKRIGLVERTGRGIDTIYEGQLRYGRPAPDYSRSTPATVQVVLPGGPANMALVRWFVERAATRPIELEELIVINLVDRERRIDSSTAAVAMQRSESTARAILERLVEGGILEGRGERPRRVYMFSGATYRAIGQQAAHARARGFDPIQREQMVLQYVATHGRITRSEAADLCQISADAAKRLLLRLVNQRALVSKGAGRATYYRLPPAITGAPDKLRARP